MTRHFATACREHQLPVLVASMLRHCGDFMLHVLDWDVALPEMQASIRTGWDHLSVLDRAVFLARHPEMAPDRLPGPPRRPVDQVCTVRWTFVVDLMEDLREPVTLIDGDVWMMASSEPVFAEIGAAPMAVVPHGFPLAAAGLPGVTEESHSKFGRWNNGWVYFADLAPAREMARLTREWSYTAFLTLPSGRVVFGDQGWSEIVAEQFGAHAIKAPTNVGPWGVHARPLAERSDGVCWGGERLISYHFSSMRFDGDVVTRYADPSYEITAEQQRILYHPYAEEVRRCNS